MRDQELPPVDRALKYVQQDLRNILTVADSCEQPMPLAATTNEVYKQSRRKGYSQEDYSTVHFKRRYGETSFTILELRLTNLFTFSVLATFCPPTTVAEVAIASKTDFIHHPFYSIVRTIR